MKQAIILASFGVSDPKIRADTLDLIESEIRQNFSEIEVIQTFTSNSIRQSLGMTSIDDLLRQFAEKKVERTIILPILLTPGEEYYNKILSAGDSFVSKSNAMRILTLPPVFSDEDEPTENDLSALDTILQIFPFKLNEELILLGHGSPHEHNPTFETLQEISDQRAKKSRKKTRINFGVFEPSDYPNFDDVLERLKSHNAKRILLGSLLISGGSHVEDVLNWKSKLESEGFIVRTETRGLATFPEFRKIFLNRIQAAQPKEMEKVPLFVQMYGY